MRGLDRRRIAGIAVLVGFAGFLLTSPLYFLTSGYRLDIARLAIYVGILAATWSLLAGIAGQFSFAHVAIAGLGAYASSIWVRDVSGTVGSVWVGIVIGTVFAWMVGTALGLLLLRLRAAYLALFTIAFAEMARLAVVAETDLTGGRLSLAVIRLPGSEIAHHYLMLALLALELGIIYLLLRSRFGLFLRAMREDEEAAAAMGVNVVRMKVLIFSITSLLLGFAATVYTHTTPRLTPERLDLLFMGQVIAVAVIGGIESPLAAAIGALVMFGILENLRRIDLSPAAFDALTVLLAVAVVAMAWGVWRAVRRSGERVPPDAKRQLGWLLATGFLLGVFLYRVGDASGPGAWLVWTLFAAAVAALTVFLSRMYSGGLPGWFERQMPRLTIAMLGAVVLARMVTGTSLAVELGVWRFGVFGAVLMLTLRFARNGLVQPALDYFFSGRHEAIAQTVSKRDAAEAPEEVPA